MKRNYVVDRIRSVICSCRTSDQINCAIVYSKLLIDRWLKGVYSISSGEYSSKNLIFKYQERELFEWMNVQVTKQRLAMRYMDELGSTIEKEVV